MDAAAEYRGYAADITRTIPVSGTFTPEQRRIYQLVRDAQGAAERNAGRPQRRRRPRTLPSPCVPAGSRRSA